MVAELLSPRKLRHAPDWLLHGWRRRAALARLARRPRPLLILVVCHGNICRSPFAGAALWRALSQAGESGIRVASAGFVGPGRAPPTDGVRAAAARGIDLAAHRSALLTADLVRVAHLIVVMEPLQGREIEERFGRPGDDILVLGDVDPWPIETRAIQDPVEQPLEIFHASYARIERCVHALVSAIRG